MIEFEAKAILNVSEYKFLINHFYKKEEVSIHINYYYDTDNFELDQLGITCRIREKNGQYIATIKDHQPHGCSIEASQTVKNLNDTTFFGKMGINLQGTLKTIRTTIITYNGISVMIDENHYLDMTDYEIEYEYSPEQYQEVQYQIKELAEILKQNEIVESAEEFYGRFGKEKNKSARFFYRKNKLKTPLKMENKIGKHRM